MARPKKNEPTAVGARKTAPNKSGVQKKVSPKKASPNKNSTNKAAVIKPGSHTSTPTKPKRVYKRNTQTAAGVAIELPHAAVPTESGQDSGLTPRKIRAQDTATVEHALEASPVLQLDTNYEDELYGTYELARKLALKQANTKHEPNMLSCQNVAPVAVMMHRPSQMTIDVNSRLRPYASAEPSSMGPPSITPATETLLPPAASPKLAVPAPSLAPDPPTTPSRALSQPEIRPLSSSPRFPRFPLSQLSPPKCRQPVLYVDTVPLSQDHAQTQVNLGITSGSIPQEPSFVRFTPVHRIEYLPHGKQASWKLAAPEGLWYDTHDANARRSQLLSVRDNLVAPLVAPKEPGIDSDGSMARDVMSAYIIEPRVSKAHSWVGLGKRPYEVLGYEEGCALIDEFFEVRG